MAKLLKYDTKEFKEFFGVLGQEIYCVSVYRPDQGIMSDVIQYQFEDYQTALEWAEAMNANDHMTSLYKMLAIGVNSDRD